MRIEQQLADVGIALPAPLEPPGNFELVTVHGGLAYIAGHGPFDGSTRLTAGRVGDDLTLEQGYEAARLTALSILASLKRELGELDRVTRWLRAVGTSTAGLDLARTLWLPTASVTSSSSSGATADAMPAPPPAKDPHRSTSPSSSTRSSPSTDRWHRILSFSSTRVVPDAPSITSRERVGGDSPDGGDAGVRIRLE